MKEEVINSSKSDSNAAGEGQPLDCLVCCRQSPLPGGYGVGLRVWPLFESTNDAELLTILVNREH